MLFQLQPLPLLMLTAASVALARIVRYHHASLTTSGQQLGLRIHAKQKLPLAYNALLQAHGEIETATRKPSLLAILARHFFPQRKKSGAVELAWTILDFRKGQDVRIKAGYELYRKVPHWAAYLYCCLTHSFVHYGMYTGC
ncbi:hypothetical protein VPH35_050405 [Triticum aestivum]|uniref:Uncharacterized protein n=1 Tax=Triticum aestivum TaxID=4565 RepID=A0A077RTJ9_WHEAT|nr:unnamed protein product [Triticum aestivum]